MTFVLLLAAGVVAGLLTTVAGLGGGILLIAGLSLFWPPALVLAVTAPALMVGNLTRMWSLRQAIDWRVVGLFCLAAVPTALAGSLVAAQMPERLLKLAIALFLLGFVIHEIRGKGKSVVVSGQAWLSVVGGAMGGFLSAVTGGGAFVSTPFFLRYGLEKTVLVATSAACMAAVHLTKVVGFSAGQMLTLATLVTSAWLAVGIAGGNVLGARVLNRMDSVTFKRVLLGGLVLASLQLMIAV